MNPARSLQIAGNAVRAVLPGNRMKIDHEIPVEAGQKFQVDAFKEADALGIANLFYAVYGADYPFETYYIPGKIIAENRCGNIHSVVARTPGGDIIAHGAIFRSSAPYPNLYEIGQYIVLKSYRDSFAAYKINQYIAETLVKAVNPDGLFGEAVCNHTTTQKASALIGMKDMALEVALMPSETYQREKNGCDRVSCLIQFRSYHDRPHTIFVPPAYRREIEFAAGGPDFTRTLLDSIEPIPPDIASNYTTAFLSFAGVVRTNVEVAGSDIAAIIDDIERQASAKRMEVLQFFLNLAMPWSGKVVDIFRKKGYFSGGYVPRWFDTDAILMQKNQTDPNFESIALYSPSAATIKDFVQSDWARAQKHRGVTPS
jgi:hypothetical protein